jgi:hypothetical protein
MSFFAATLLQQVDHIRGLLADNPALAADYHCGCPTDPGPTPCDASIIAKEAPHAGHACPNAAKAE